MPIADMAASGQQVVCGGAGAAAAVWARPENIARVWKYQSTTEVESAVGSCVAAGVHLENLSGCKSWLAHSSSSFPCGIFWWQTSNHKNRSCLCTQEMIGLCTVLHPDGNDALKYFGRAFESYGKISAPAGRVLATRCVLLAAQHQATIGRHDAANGLLLRAVFQVNSVY